jgi:hypothetical protein
LGPSQGDVGCPWKACVSRVAKGALPNRSHQIRSRVGSCSVDLGACLGRFGAVWGPTRRVRPSGHETAPKKPQTDPKTAFWAVSGPRMPILSRSWGLRWGPTSIITQFKWAHKGQHRVLGVSRCDIASNSRFDRHCIKLAIYMFIPPYSGATSLARLSLAPPIPHHAYHPRLSVLVTPIPRLISGSTLFFCAFGFGELAFMCCPLFAFVIFKLHAQCINQCCLHF